MLSLPDIWCDAERTVVGLSSICMVALFGSDLPARCYGLVTAAPVRGHGYLLWLEHWDCNGSLRAVRFVTVWHISYIRGGP